MVLNKPLGHGMTDLVNFCLNRVTLGEILTPHSFIRHQVKHILLVQIYVDDIIFGSTNMHLIKEFSKLMYGEFEMSLTGESNYFIRLQIKKLDEGTFVCQTKYCLKLLKIFEWIV